MMSKPGQYHLLQRPGGHDIDALPIGRLLGALQDTGMLAELPTHFIDHVARGRPNGPYRHGREQKDQHRSQQATDKDLGLGKCPPLSSGVP